MQCLNLLRLICQLCIIDKLVPLEVDIGWCWNQLDFIWLRINCCVYYHFHLNYAYYAECVKVSTQCLVVYCLVNLQQFIEWQCEVWQYLRLYLFFSGVSGCCYWQNQFTHLYNFSFKRSSSPRFYCPKFSLQIDCYGKITFCSICKTLGICTKYVQHIALVKLLILCYEVLV